MAPVQEADDNTSCPVGASKRFECQVIGLPRPSVRWYKDGVNITTDSRYKFEYTQDGCVVLVLENVTADDQGVYSCTAQNSEGSAETAAKLFIKGTLSAEEANTPSVHPMASFKKIKDATSSKTQKRPIQIGKSNGIDKNVGDLKDVQGDESLEKGTREIEQQKNRKEFEKDAARGKDSSAGKKLDDDIKSDELSNMVDDLLEMTKFGNSGRRLTTDSGITSRGSSFSSEPDISMTEETMKEMKEYLHGKADALYQSFEHGKLKEITESDVEVRIAQSQKLIKKEKAMRSKEQIVSMTELTKEKIDFDRVNELEASVLAGMYLFDTGPTDKTDEYRHGIPALELLVRKEAFENISDRGMSQSAFEDTEINSNTNVEKCKLKEEFYASEIIQETQTADSIEVEKLNAINIKRNKEIVKKQKETKLFKAKTVTCVEDEDEDETMGKLVTGKDKTDISVDFCDEKNSSKHESIDQTTELTQTNQVKQFVNERTEKKKKFHKSKSDSVSSADETVNDRIDAGISCDTTQSKNKNDGFSSSSKIDDNAKAADDLDLGKAESIESSEEDFYKRKGEKTSTDDATDKYRVDIDKQSTDGQVNKSQVSVSSGLSNDLAASDELEKNEEVLIQSKQIPNADKKGDIVDRPTKTKRNEDSLDQNGGQKQKETGNALSCDTADSIYNEKKSLSLQEENESKSTIGSRLDEGISVENQQLQDTKERSLVDNKRQSKTDEALKDFEANLKGIVIDTEKQCSAETVQTMHESGDITEENIDSKPTACSDHADLNDCKVSGKTEEDGSAQELSVKSLQLDRSEKGIDKKVKDEGSNKTGDQKSEIGNLEQELNGDNTLNPTIEDEGIQKRLSDSLESSGPELIEGLDGKNTPETDNKKSNKTSEQQLCEQESNVEYKANKDRDKESVEENQKLMSPGNKNSNTVEKVVLEQIIAEERSNTENKSELEHTENKDFQSDKIADKTKTDRKDANADSDRLNAANDTDSSVKEKSREKQEINVSIETESKVEKLKMESSKENNIHQERLAKSEEEISIECVDVDIKGVSKEEQTLEEFNRNKMADLEKKMKVKDNHEKVEEAKVPYEKTKAAKAEQQDLKKERVYRLCSANETADAGRQFTEPLKDLVYLDDTHPEIPNIINIIPNMKENEIRKKDASLTEEIENKMMPLNDISEESSLVACVKVTEAIDSLMVQSADAIDLATLDSEQSIVEKTELSKESKTEIINRRTTIKEDLETDANAAEIETVKISEANEISTDLNADVKEEEIIAETSNKESQIPSLDKVLEPNLKTVDKAKKAIEETPEENLIKEKSVVESEIPVTEPISKEEIKSELEKVCFDKITEESIVPEQAIKEEKMQNLQNLEKMATKQKDETNFNETLSQKEDESIPLDIQKQADNKEPKKIPNAKVEEKTDKTLKLERSKLNVEVLLDDTHVQVTEGFPVKLQWKITGIELSKVSIYKDGQKIKFSGNLHLDIADNIYSLTVDKATVDDEATYSVRTEGSEMDHGEIRVHVTTSEKKQNIEAEESEILVESVVDVKEGKQLSVNSFVGDTQKIGDAEEPKQIQDVTVDEKIDKTSKPESLKLKVEALLDDPHVKVPEGFPAKLQWKISGIELSKISIYKDGQKIKFSGNLHVDITDDIYSLTVDKATVDDEATYSVRTEGSKIDHGEIRVHVTTSVEKQSTKAEESKLIVESDVDTKEVRQLSVKSSVSDTQKIGDVEEPKRILDITVDEKTDKTSKPESLKLKVEALLDDPHVQVPEGFPAKLQWKVSGIELSKISIYKDGQKIKFSGNLHVDITDDIYSLTVDKATVDDEATYSVRTEGSEMDHGEIRIHVTTSEEKSSTEAEEPKFIVEPVVDVKEGRRLSIKCSVSGSPAPEVIWYHQGQQLDPSALWDIYSQDGYHYLTVGDPSMLDCEEIVCRVENDKGFVQRVIAVKTDGDEVYCEPVLPPVSPEPSEGKEIPPIIEIEISEIVTTNLRKLPLADDFTDRLNFVTMNAGEVVEILASVTEETMLARNLPQKEKVCYIPKQALAVSHDVSRQVCENASAENNTGLTEQKLQSNKEEATMPERRKMKSPSPKMTSTPKMKRKEMDTESTEELQKRLGFSDNLAQRKEFSTPDSVEFTEYNDGTTRPMFKKRLKSVTAKSGEMAQLECTVSGSPLPKILWLKNNRPLKASDGCKVIVDEGTNILVFPQARDEDVGIYTARAMNVNGSIMCSAEFTLSDGNGLPAQPVTDSPMDMDFTTPAYFFQMSSCEVSEGRLARFDCRVVAYPKPEIVWMRDGKVIEAEQRFKLLNFNNEIYSLLVQDVRIEDTGRYTCWARNKFGEAMTEAYLNVLALSDQEPEGDLAPKFLTRFYDQQTTEGTATDFKCLIAGRPEPSVTWLLDDLEIREGQGVRMRHKDGMVSLEIKSPKVDQSGTYTCQLNNPLGEATCSARLTVVEDKLHGKMLPKFLKKFDHVTVKEGEEARFTSVIIGEPRPDVIWLFDHKPISDTNRRFMTKKEGDAYTLIIKNVRFDDAGKITCKASNEEGEVYCSANLHVRESKFMTDLPEKTGVRSQDEIDAKFGYVPTFTRRLQDLEVKEGSRASFECKVMGIPDPEISWMKDGRVITPGGRYRMTFEGGTGQLVIDNVTATDTGVYTCIVSNSQGKSSSTAALKLEEPKKERYTPDRLLEERTSRKERYTPDKYLLDDSTIAKRPYLDTDRYDAAKVRKSYDSPNKLDDTYLPRPKKKYDSPKSSYDTFKPKYETNYESPKRSLESPRRQFDSAYTRLESPVRQIDTYTRYESPVRPYESVSTKYDSPIRPYDSVLTRYESPVRAYESLSTKYESPIRPYEGVSTKYESPVRRYESPVRQFDSGSPRTLYESPRRRSSVGREEKIKAVPKIPFDRPALLNKRDDSVQLSWLPAPTYNLPDDARHVSYIIESREIPSRDWTKVAASVPGTSYTVRNLRPDKEYEFRVRAQNQHGVSEPTWNATFDKRVDETSKKLDLPEMRAPPRLPTHRPIITDLGEETMRLAWRPVETYQARRTPPVSYRLEAKELPGRDWMPLSSHLRDTTHYLSELARDRDYMIRVRAENDFGISEPTEPLWIPRATAFPGVPVTRPEIIDYEDTRAKLSWTRVDIPTFGLDDTPLLYMLEVEEPPHKDWRTIARDLDDTEYIVEGLQPGHDYRFRVRAKTPTGIISEPSPAVSLYTKLAQTRAPIDRLEVLEYEPDTKSVNLSWDRVNIPPYNLDEEPLMYMLEYQEPPLPEWKTLVTGIPTTRYRVMHLDRDRDYNFRVRALTPYGISPPSPALPVTLRKTPGPVTRGLPEKVIISEVDAHSLRLTWRRPMYDMDKPISYQVEMLESPFSDWRPIASRVLETTYKVTGLKPTRDYQFRVIPQVDTEYLAPSPSAALTTMPVKPRLPYAEPRLKELTPESVQLSWGAAELPAYQRKRSPLHYKVEMAEMPSSNWVPVSRKVTDTSYTVTGLRPNQEYKFRIFAESDSGLSEPSMPVTLYRRPAPKFPLKEPSIRDLSQNVVHLTWSPAEVPSGAEGVSYMVEIQTPPGISTWNTLYRQHPTPGVRLADLRPDLDYLVRVRAQSGTYLSEPTLPVYIPRRAAPPRLPVEEPYAVEITPDFVKLQWRSADLPTHIQDYAPVSYRLEAQELPDSNWVTIARGIPYTDFKVTGLNAQRDYNFRVRAENEYGLSDPTRPMAIRKRAVPPTLPTYEPMLYDIGPGSTRLSWRPASLPSFMPSQSPITYTLFVQDLPYKTWRPLVKGIPHTSYYVTGLQPDKEYMFRVQAENQFGSSKPTDAVRLPRFKDHTRPISVPEVSDFDEDLTSVKLRWMPTRTSPPFETKSRKYTIETWEPVRREWKPVARGVPDTSYQIKGLPKLPDHLFRVRMDTEEPTLSEPSIPVSLSRYSLPRAPMYRPQLYELEDESVRLSWQPVNVPEGVSRRSVRYTIEQREIPEPHWSPIATDIMETSYKVRGLRSKNDYEFRVKATYDGISTEPSYPVSLFRRAVIPKVRLDAPEVYDVEDTSLSLRWNTVDVPAFTPDEEPLLFVIERQTLPSYEWQPVASNITDRSYTIKDLKPYQDYNFRVRGVYPSGYTEPSPNVPVYRRPIRPSVPVARTEVLEEEPYSARLRWHRAYIPRYYSSTPISYRIEMQEAGETDKEWEPVAMDLTTPDYTVRNISPRKDYRFRIRAKTENGDISEPTPPITFYRTQVPLMKDRENALSEFKPVEYKAIFLKHPYYEVLTKYVPPSMPIHKPDMIVIDMETVELTWRPAIVAEAIKYTCNLTYTIEVRCPPSFEWRELVTGLKICSHTVQKLHPRIDYVFRVRAWNEYGCSEASLPVSLYRPAVYRMEGEEEIDDEEFEREWKRRYGREVPPKLPIDTPRVVTQSSDSIWFTWLPARIPAYATQTNINYVVEIREPPSTAWQRDATDLVDCQYVKEGLNPNQEYHIRVRAETEFGASDPTMPIIIRGKGSRPGSRRSSVERDDRSLEDKIDLSYLDNVMSGVPPRMASSRPLSSCVGPDKLTLSWSPCRTPSYVKASNVTYIIEKRELPGHVWSVLAKDITVHRFDITGLNPEQDYMFRIRAKNEFGLSEPTLPMTLYRERDDYVPPKIRSRSSSRDSISMYVSKVMRRSSSIDYSNVQMEDDRSSQERIPCQPQYIPTTYDTQYGVLGKKGKITLEVRGYPLPTVHWYRGEEKIEYGGQFNAFVTPGGGITLEIKNVGLDTVGEFKCYAENGSGAAVKVVTFQIAEPPTVLVPVMDVSAFKGDSVKLSCKVDGFPSPTVKWMKDWRPLTDCTRTKMIDTEPETFSLEIAQLIETDEGLYACTVENIAGKVTVTGRLSVEIDSFPERDISIKSTPIEEHYHILEEIGRGRYGVVRRVVDISTGRTFAANFMSMRNRAQKNFFKSEFEVLRLTSKMGGVLRLYDAFETDRSLIFVTEILSEPELMEKIIADGNWTEGKVAAVIRKLLFYLQELARLNILHLDIKPSNIRMCGSDLEDIKLIGFGLSRILQPDEELMHNYGSVGYASPEQVTNNVLTPNTDMWAVGVLAYILLSGNGPFQGSSEIEILNFMSECSWTFEGRGFEKFSKEGLDFISKLLVKDASKRMTVEECLNHPWMSTNSDAKINTEQLRQFYTAEKLQRETEKVFTTVQLQSFAKIIHGAKALYQPAVDIESGEIIFPDSDEYGDYLDEDAWYEWQFQYNDDPDSQIFPIQDKKFTVRECRHAGAPKYSKPKAKERSDKDVLDTGTGILFSDKIQPTTFLVGEDVVFTATVVSECGEVPVVTWYRDEQLLSDDYRADASFNPVTGLAKLKIVNSKDYDAAVYKCVARVKDGRVSCEARLLLGDVPSKPGCPLVMQTSGSEAFLTWNGPVSDGNSYLLGYRVDYRKQGEKKWTHGPYVTEEYALLTGLEPESSYIFRVSGHNKYGASPFSWSSLETKTLDKNAPKVSIASYIQPSMQFSTFDKQQLILPAQSRRPSVTGSKEAKVNESDPNEDFTFADTISKGSYGEYKLCTNKTTNQECVVKIVPYNKDRHAEITSEFELLGKLRHANLVSVLDSYISGEQFFVIYESLSGLNILQYLCIHKMYKEETVARLIRQVLDALQYLEHYGIVHLNLQPSSIIMATRRRPHVKLRDFTLAQNVEDDKGIKVPLAGYPDFTSPEVLKGENVTFTADLWTVGALTFTMLSGISPFGGKDLEGTLSRILFDRYSTKDMYDNVTEESVKFVGKLLCRLPRNRPTVTKCLCSQWLNLSESMVTARNSKMFKSEKLSAFSVDYLTKRSDLNYSLALVDIKKLPKITPGPHVQPILGDKITNRLENISKTKRESTDLAEAIRKEVSVLPGPPLLEKIVNKIEKENVTEKSAEVAHAIHQNVEFEETKVRETEDIKEKLPVSEKIDEDVKEILTETVAAEASETEEKYVTEESIRSGISAETEDRKEIISEKENTLEDAYDGVLGNNEMLHEQEIEITAVNAQVQHEEARDVLSVDQMEQEQTAELNEVIETKEKTGKENVSVIDTKTDERPEESSVLESKQVNLNLTDTELNDDSLELKGKLTQASKNSKEVEEYTQNAPKQNNVEIATTVDDETEDQKKNVIKNDDEETNGITSEIQDTETEKNEKDLDENASVNGKQNEETTERTVEKETPEEKNIQEEVDEKEVLASVGNEKVEETHDEKSSIETKKFSEKEQTTHSAEMISNITDKESNKDITYKEKTEKEVSESIFEAGDFENEKGINTVQENVIDISENEHAQNQKGILLDEAMQTQFDDKRQEGAEETTLHKTEERTVKEQKETLSNEVTQIQKENNLLNEIEERTLESTDKSTIEEQKTILSNESTKVHKEDMIQNIEPDEMTRETADKTIVKKQPEIISNETKQIQEDDRVQNEVTKETTLETTTKTYLEEQKAIFSNEETLKQRDEMIKNKQAVRMTLDTKEKDDQEQNDDLKQKIDEIEKEVPDGMALETDEKCDGDEQKETLSIEVTQKQKDDKFEGELMEGMTIESKEKNIAEEQKETILTEVAPIQKEDELNQEQVEIKVESVTENSEVIPEQHKVKNTKEDTCTESQTENVIESQKVSTETDVSLKNRQAEIQKEKVSDIVKEQLELEEFELKSSLVEVETLQSETDVIDGAESDKRESAKSLSELAEREAEEIKTAALEEIASVLKISTELRETEILKTRENESSASPTIEVESNPDVTSTVDKSQPMVDESEIDLTSAEIVQRSNISNADVVQDSEFSEKINVQKSEQVIKMEEGTELYVEENNIKNTRIATSVNETDKQEILLSDKSEIMKTEPEKGIGNETKDRHLESCDMIENGTDISEKKFDGEVKVSVDEIDNLKDTKSKDFSSSECGQNLIEECQLEAFTENLSECVESASLVSTKKTEVIVSSNAEKEVIETDATERISEKNETTVSSVSIVSKTEVDEQVDVKMLEHGLKENKVMSYESVSSTDINTTVQGEAESEFIVTQTETHTPVGKASEINESVTAITTSNEDVVHDSADKLEQCEIKEVISKQKHETLASGSIVSDMKDGIEIVSNSVVEDLAVESSVSSSLETAKVIQSRETIREFITNDDDIEEMKKEILEDLEITSADCGKYLMGSHEDLSSIKEKIERKPDEEEIEKETTNRYIDDALMFC